MKHIRNFNQVNESNSEFLSTMNPRVDQLIDYLQDYKERINRPNSEEDDTYADNEKVDKMWADVFHTVTRKINTF